MLGVLITFLGEIGISQWSSPRLGKGKSMCLRWFRSLCWTDERHSRCNRKMDRSSGRTQVVFVLPRCSWYRWRSNWLRVHKFPRIFIIVNSSRNRERHGDAENPARGVYRPDHLHANVQWHCMEHEWWELCFECRKSQEFRNEVLSQQDIGHSWVQARKKSGMEVQTTLKKGNGLAQPTKMEHQFKKTGHLVCKGVSALSRGSLKAEER